MSNGSSNLDTKAQKPLRKRRRNTKFSLPEQPALPVKALWEMASPEQRQKAHEASSAIMEYWLGRITRQEMAVRLKSHPLRAWQLCQQAISGMVAGLLIQPKQRAPKGALNMGLKEPTKPENNPETLRKRIAYLEKLVSDQERLIVILREMPGCRDAKIPMEEPITEQEAVTPQPGTTAHGAAKATGVPGAAAAKTKKATEPVPTGARHEAQAGSSGAVDHARKTRPGA